MPTQQRAVSFLLLETRGLQTSSMAWRGCFQEWDLRCEYSREYASLDLDGPSHLAVQPGGPHPPTSHCEHGHTRVQQGWRAWRLAQNQEWQWGEQVTSPGVCKASVFASYSAAEINPTSGWEREVRVSSFRIKYAIRGRLIQLNFKLSFNETLFCKQNKKRVEMSWCCLNTLHSPTEAFAPKKRTHSPPPPPL